MSTATPQREMPLTRSARRRRPERVPTPVPGEPGLFVVDATWGTINPMELATGVRTVGELEVIEHLRAGGDLVDTRPAHAHRAGTLPGARNLPHADILDGIGALDPDRPTVFFCNGPQCSATPQAIGQLLGAGHPPEAILYYRGGMHDWTTLGLPVADDKGGRQ
jgi:rhodanese-related sulfurtransferase